MKNKYLKYLFPIIGIIIIALAYFLWPKASTQSIKPTLAKMLNIDEAFLHMNLPPADGRYPGTILLRPPHGSLLVIRKALRPITDSSSPTSDMKFISNMDEKSQFEFGLSQFNSGAKNEGNLVVTIGLSNIRVLEYYGGISVLREQLLADTDVLRMRSRQQEPEVVVNAIEALPVFVIKRGANFSAEMWQEKVNDLRLRFGANLNERGELRITTTAPVVVAFETQRISFVTDNMAPGAPKKVELTPVKSDSNEAKLYLPFKHESTKEHSRIGFLVIGNSKYRHPDLGDLPAVPSSTELVKQSLITLGAEPIALETKVKESWTKGDLISAFQKAAVESKKKNTRADHLLYRTFRNFLLRTYLSIYVRL